MIYSRYYSEFKGETFVIQAEGEAVEDSATMRAILQGIDDLLRHGIRVLLVFGKGTQFEAELRMKYEARTHPETNRLVIPEAALPRIREARARIADAIEGICEGNPVPHCVVPESAIRVERRIGHGSTGVPTEFDVEAIRSVLEQSKLAIVGFGGEDDRGRFLHVPSVTVAADLAVALGAQKLLFLMQSDGISVPDCKKGSRRLSFADLEELLCLLQRRDQSGEFIISGSVLPKVHASIRAVAGGVNQVHLVSYSRLLDEIHTRTGVGTMIERRQSHHVDYARAEDLDDVCRLHVESEQYRSPHGTPYVKPLDRRELASLLPRTLLLRHRGVLIGKLHAVPVSGEGDTLQIGGFVIAENHQDSQQGQLLLSEALARLLDQGCSRAVAITASERAQSLFARSGGELASTGSWRTSLLQKAVQRYAVEERDQVRLFEFALKKPGSP
ncbi:GNAT family N-acetyltransferase [Planctomycetota bacterium]